MKKQILLSILSLVLVLAALVALVYVLSKPDKTESYKLEAMESLAVASLRLAIAESGVNGRAEASVYDCGILQSVTKDYDKSTDWFEDCDDINKGSMPDTSNNAVLKLSDGHYCATYTFDENVEKLMGFSFTEGECGDRNISII